MTLKPWHLPPPNQRYASSPSTAKAFKIKSIMEHGPDKIICPFSTSSSPFGVFYENNFALSDDGRYLIGVDGKNLKQLLVEDLHEGSSFRFGDHEDAVTSLIFDHKKATLLAGDLAGHVIQYKLDLVKQKSLQTKNYGNLGIGQITSSSKLMNFVFFAGTKNIIKVMDFSQRQMVWGQLSPIRNWVLSFRVCVVDKSSICLVVVGDHYLLLSKIPVVYFLGGMFETLCVPSKIVNDDKQNTVFKSGPERPRMLEPKMTPSLKEFPEDLSIKKDQKMKNLEDKLKKLEQKLIQRNRENDALLIDKIKLRDENQQLKQVKDSQKETISALRKTKENLKMKISQNSFKPRQSEEKSQKSIEEVNSLKSMLEKPKSDTNFQKQTSSLLLKTESKLKESEKQRQMAQKELKSLKSRINKLEKQNQNQRETISDIHKTKDNLNSKLSRLESKLKQSEKQQLITVNLNKSIEAKLIKLNKKSNAKISQLRLKLRISNYSRKDHKHIPLSTTNQHIVKFIRLKPSRISRTS